jgi:hypothetical protein
MYATQNGAVAAPWAVRLFATQQHAGTLPAFTGRKHEGSPFWLAYLLDVFGLCVVCTFRYGLGGWEWIMPTKEGRRYE